MLRDDPEICRCEVLVSNAPFMYQLRVIPTATLYAQVKEALSPWKLYRLLLGLDIRTGDGVKAVTKCTAICDHQCTVLS